MNISPGSLIDVQVAPEPALGGLVTPSKVIRMRKFTMKELVDKLDTRIAQKTDESLITTTGDLEDGHNLTFARGALKQANQKVLMSLMNDEKVRKVLEAAILQKPFVQP